MFEACPMPSESVHLTTRIKYKRQNHKYYYLSSSEKTTASTTVNNSLLIDMYIALMNTKNHKTNPN